MNKQQIETRENAHFVTGNIRIEERADGGESRKVVGYAATFNKWSLPLYGGWFREKVSPGAFDAVLDQDVVAVFNHNDNYILARNKKTLNLSVDAVGLRYEFDAPKSSNGDNILEAIRRGDIIGSSFRFIPKTVQWEQKPDDNEVEEERTIIEVEQLIDVGPVTFPAYPSSTAEVIGRSYRNECDAFHASCRSDVDNAKKGNLEMLERELKLYQ